MKGPYTYPPLQNIHVSLLALIEKKRKGSDQLIHDLSHPKSSSVNDKISKDKGTVKYQTLDNAIDTIL